MSSTIWYTERQASGVWPYPFIDVTAKTSQQGPSLDVIFTACAANQAGDLHVLASDVAGKLWHTILLANGSWPFPFGDVQASVRGPRAATFPHRHEAPQVRHVRPAGLSSGDPLVQILAQLYLPLAQPTRGAGSMFLL
jgi:hypothetical protein